MDEVYRKVGTVAKNSSPLDDTPVARELARDMKRLRKVKEDVMKRPSSTRIFAIANQKGGVGKTSSAVNIAGALADGGLRVVVIDADPQGNASTALGVDPASAHPTLHDVFLGNRTLRDIEIKNEKHPRLSVMPSDISLSMVDVEFGTSNERYAVLDAALRTYLAEAEENGDRIDYVIIDCPPSMSMLPINALVAAREVLIPVQAEYYALEGLSQLLQTIATVHDNYNSQLRVSTILITMAARNTNLSTEVAENVREYFPHETLETEIPRSVRIAEAPSYGETVISYAPRSSGAIAYQAAALEIAKRG